MALPPKPRLAALPFAIALAALAFCGGAHLAAAQRAPDTPTEETVANLAAGRVVFAVVKDGIIVGTIENPIEVQTLVPRPVMVSSERFGILLGPVEWWSPSSHREIAQLDRELPHLHPLAMAAPPHLGQSQGGDVASDIETIGENLLQRLNEIAPRLHSKLSLGANEPFAQLILADYLAGYGPEIWQLSYGLDQEEDDLGYWSTRVLRPRYLQFWPPEKKQPRTLVEFNYPAENAPTPLLQLLRDNDPRLAAIRSSDPQMAEVADRLLAGQSEKLKVGETVQFLRAALDAVSPPHAHETMAVLKPETGLTWILQPPPIRPTGTTQPQRPPGAPTLAPTLAPSLAHPPQ